VVVLVVCREGERRVFRVDELERRGLERERRSLKLTRPLLELVRFCSDSKLAILRGRSRILCKRSVLSVLRVVVATVFGEMMFIMRSAQRAADSNPTSGNRPVLL
jgi:hypothetical protein